jgi:hypothetical protein
MTELAGFSSKLQAETKGKVEVEVEVAKFNPKGHGMRESARFLEFLTYIFLFIVSAVHWTGLGGAMLMATNASDVLTPMHDLGLLRFHPTKDVNYHFGFHRMVRAEYVEDVDDVSADDDYDIYSYEYNVSNYEDCKDDIGGNGIMSQDTCRKCYEAGLASQNLLLAVALAYTLWLYIPTILVVLVTGKDLSLTLQKVAYSMWAMTPYFYDTPHYRTHIVLRGKAPTEDWGNSGMLDYWWAWNKDRPLNRLFRYAHILFPTLVLITCIAGIRSFDVNCVSAVKGDQDNNNSMHEGGGAIILLYTVPAMLASVIFAKALACYWAEESMAIQKKDIESYLMELPPGAAGNQDDNPML